MLGSGFDRLVTAVLTLVGTAVHAARARRPARPRRAAAAPGAACCSRCGSGASPPIAYRRTRETVALVIVHFVESMTGIRAVQAFRREPRNQEIFERLNADYRDANRRSMHLIALFMPGIKLIGNVTVAVVLLYGGLAGAARRRSPSACSPPSCSTCGSSTSRCRSQPVLQLAAVGRRRAGEARRACWRSGPRWPSRPVRRRCPPGRGRGARCGSRAWGSRYGDGPAGAAPARPGDPGRADRGGGRRRPGAGKTTLAKLIARFYDPVAGRVLLDGVDLRDLDEATLRRAVVMVTQENFLFSGTVADNIRFGRPDATMAEVVAAAQGDRRARVHRRAARRLRHPGGQARRAHVGRASGSSSRSPGRSSPTRRCSSSTRRPPASTCRASGWCSGRCAPCSPTVPR